jgi:pilus assembly protein CpaF
MRTREANNDGAGRVAPSECIRGGMRMAMNRIIFGEIRDAEAAEAFIDVCASGHPGLSTIHARSAIDTIARLELFLGRAQKGVSQSVLQQQIGTAVHVVVHIDICKDTGRRRIMEVVELGSVADGVLRHRNIFRYAPVNGSASWSVENRISTYRDQIESMPEGVLLNKYPTQLELSSSHAFKDAAATRTYG